MTPRCYNRPPRADGRWHEVGRDPGTGRPRLRWFPRWYADTCTQHDGEGIGPKGESYAAAHGFECAGCRWEPDRIRQAREFVEGMCSRHFPSTRPPVDNPGDKAGLVHMVTELPMPFPLAGQPGDKL